LKYFPDFKTAYAIKSNPHQEIISIIDQSAGYYETASYSEIQYLLDLDIPAERIIFSNPVKARECIENALVAGVNKISFDSLDELKKFAIAQKNTGKKVHAIFRIEVSNEGSIWPLRQKFGAHEKFWDGIYDYIRTENLYLEGITFHVGSQAESLNVWELAMPKARRAFEKAFSYGLKPDLLNIGGGFPIFLGREIPSLREISEVIHRHLEDWKRDGIIIRNLYAEPGRYVSGSAGTLIANVIGVAERENQRWVFLDAGVFNGMMETIDGITYPTLSTGQGTPETVMLCGPTCDSVDRMFEVTIPSPKVDDRLYFSGAGAYTHVYSSNFNGFKQPDVQFMDDYDAIRESEGLLVPGNE